MFKVSNVDQETIKDANKKKIINLLYTNRELTKQQIAKLMNVSIPTVINNLNELIEEGIVEEAGVADSSGGRKPIIVKFKPNSRYSFGVAISAHSIRIVLTNLDSEILEDSIYELESAMTMTSEKDINPLFDKICFGIQNIINEKHILQQHILGIGISLPGTVNEEANVLQWAPTLLIKNIDFKPIAERLNLPVYLENEANAAAFAELRLGVAKDLKNLVYISITEGIGTGIVVQDYLYKGKNKRAGEFGHMTIVKDGKKCKCGRNGCWEQYASEHALLNSYNERSKERIESLETFFNILQSGDSIAEDVLNSYLDYIAIGIQNIILIMDPHYVVIGGKISHYGELMMKALKEKVFTKNSFYNSDDIKIFTSKLKGNSSIMGAALLPLQKIFYLNEKIL